MKKIFTSVLAMGTLSAAFAQGSYRNDHQYDKSYGYNDNRRPDDRNRRDDRSVAYPNNDRHDNDRNDRQRQAERDRINHEYDQRIQTYRQNRRMESRERERRIQQLEKERNSKLKTFGGGLLLGGLIGVLLSH